MVVEEEEVRFVPLFVRREDSECVGQVLPSLYHSAPITHTHVYEFGLAILSKNNVIDRFHDSDFPKAVHAPTIVRVDDVTNNYYFFHI